MDSTRAGQLLSESDVLTKQLCEKRIAIWRGDLERARGTSGRIVAESARLDYLVERSSVRYMRRWELWCDSND